MIFKNINFYSALIMFALMSAHYYLGNTIEATIMVIPFMVFVFMCYMDIVLNKIDGITHNFTIYLDKATLEKLLNK